MLNNASIFLLKTAAKQIPAYLGNVARRILGKRVPRRDPAKVRASYDSGAERKLAFLSANQSLTLSEYVFDDFLSRSNNQDNQDNFRLIKDKMVWVSKRKAEEAVMLEIEQQLRPYLHKKGTIVEFGSGTGRNLLWLKSQYPNVNFVGLELSPKNVELAKCAAKRFGLKVDFYAVNVCERQLPELPADILTVFSVHALEQMPKIYTSAVVNMLTTSPSQVFFFEPIGELYPYSSRGLVSKMRIACLDRLSGLPAYLKKNSHLISARRLGVGVNPLNETCLIVAEK